MYLTLHFCRYKYNVSIKEINQAVVKGLLEVSLEDTSKSSKEIVQYMDKVGIIHLGEGRWETWLQHSVVLQERPMKGKLVLKEF